MSFSFFCAHRNFLVVSYCLFVSLTLVLLTPLFFSSRNTLLLFTLLTKQWSQKARKKGKAKRKVEQRREFEKHISSTKSEASRDIFPTSLIYFGIQEVVEVTCLFGRVNDIESDDTTVKME